MKARVKATGEIVEIISGVICIDKNGYKQTIHSDFIEPYIDIGTDDNYWEKLKHQYAGMAMQGILTNLGNACDPDYIVEEAEAYATALVNKLKEGQE